MSITPFGQGLEEQHHSHLKQPNEELTSPKKSELKNDESPSPFSKEHIQVEKGIVGESDKKDISVLCAEEPPLRLEQGEVKDPGSLFVLSGSVKAGFDDRGDNRPKEAIDIVVNETVRQYKKRLPQAKYIPAWFHSEKSNEEYLILITRKN